MDFFDLQPTCNPFATQARQGYAFSAPNALHCLSGKEYTGLSIVSTILTNLSIPALVKYTVFYTYGSLIVI